MAPIFSFPQLSYKSQLVSDVFHYFFFQQGSSDRMMLNTFYTTSHTILDLWNNNPLQMEQKIDRVLILLLKVYVMSLCNVKS